MLQSLRYGLAATALLITSQSHADTPQLPPPESTTLSKLQLMQGFPPPPDKLVTQANFNRFPNGRWALHHMRELQPSRGIARDPLADVAKLKYKDRGLGDLRFDDGSGQTTTVSEWLRDTYTDAFIVLHKGRVVYETYADGMDDQDQHILWSVTKSVTGLLAADMIQRGELDPDVTVAHYVPELKDSAWGDATVQQVLDMTAAVRYREDYKDFTSDVYRYAFSSGILPKPKNYQGPASLYEFLASLTEKSGEHGKQFTYQTVQSEVVAWIISKASGRDYTDLLSERIWSKLGAERDAYVLVDPHGTPLAGGGMNATLRDLARFAEMVRRKGHYNGEQMVSKAAIEDIFKGGERSKFEGGGLDFRRGQSYHNQWYQTHNDHGALQAAGIHGQMIHIDPQAELVVVKFSSHPVASSSFTYTSTTAALDAITEALQ
ncbi:serine hydrolase domain-containing protein [Alloalcanivorax xenomutans]|uniref:Beta-lactamase family protein n=1 Tax=Alloalcanivorax xenomutans TaxID=1094342 RepID=A0A9Q3W2C7_9GAMM|nr:serine hydrolase [Alloalcanivorax xenomutans]ARB47534.1 6-aminohexanoate hydrolase [Alloalcanivorax xenomutans]MCE7508001.1 beta-lactamase family protein [Alloalcanivorax xenomutans]MCE7523256.1 beta-lactamase family protein [Alloalcanivorax xenomutans]WOA31282.1 serine hydrolase [Alloalcanivorax xenomutans]